MQWCGTVLLYMDGNKEFKTTLHRVERGTLLYKGRLHGRPSALQPGHNVHSEVLQVCQKPYRRPDAEELPSRFRKQLLGDKSNPRLQQGQAPER